MSIDKKTLKELAEWRMDNCNKHRRRKHCKTLEEYANWDYNKDLVDDGTCDESYQGMKDNDI